MFGAIRYHREAMDSTFQGYDWRTVAKGGSLYSTDYFKGSSLPRDLPSLKIAAVTMAIELDIHNYGTFPSPESSVNNSRSWDLDEVPVSKNAVSK